MKGKDLKNKSDSKISLNGEEFEILLDMNTFAELEEIYDNPYNVITDLARGSFKATRSIIWANYRRVKPNATLLEVGALLNMDNMFEITNKIFDLTNSSLPEGEEPTEGE